MQRSNIILITKWKISIFKRSWNTQNIRFSKFTSCLCLKSGTLQIFRPLAFTAHWLSVLCFPFPIPGCFLHNLESSTKNLDVLSEGTEKNYWPASMTLRLARGLVQEEVNISQLENFAWVKNWLCHHIHLTIHTNTINRIPKSDFADRDQQISFYAAHSAYSSI